MSELFITDEDREVLDSATGIEIRIIYEDGDEHEGYYDSIDDAIDALKDLKKLYTNL